MKKIKFVQGLIAMGVGVAMLGSIPIAASANSQYSATRSNSVRLVWRKSMGQHAYTATTGARYSQHLGVRYGSNQATAQMVWYTDAHEKLYQKNKGNSAIYYHVKSADGTQQGWIWRGYLKPTSSKVDATSKKTSAVADNSVTLQNAKTSAGYANAIQTESQYRLAKAVWTLFPGTKVNLWLSQHVANCDQTDILKSKPMTEMDKISVKSLKNFYVQNGVIDPAATQYWLLSARSKAFATTQNQPVSQRIKVIKQAMDNDGMTAAKRASFNGWYIGINVADSSPINGSNPNTDPENLYMWTYGVFLAPESSFQSVNNR
ncbi:hypothetical protein [Levilactobacillus enshiensis]|uniref:hypothetical protein n=1 Tax=Levilactobacillus enshiensis TaxID=2590213 RepID=UPI00177F0D57|nr:hypothetical protein [Levilactobacillus enshiensis]